MTSAAGDSRLRFEDLLTFASDLLVRSGMPRDKAGDVAAILVEGQAMGKTTHGLALLPAYLREIEDGGMALEGGPEVIQDRGPCLTWDGRKLPGPWLTLRALDEAMARAKTFGIGAVCVQRSHHAACLGAYLKRATDQGLMLLLTLTDPGFSSVAPFGGIAPVLTSNPIAFGAPTSGPPILVDTSTAIMTNAVAAGYRQRGEPLPYPDLLDNQGHPTTDPAALATTPPGTILPLGGVRNGHKGASIGLVVELLTGCLSGFGRAEPHQGWSAALLLLAIDPAAFGGDEAYSRQVDHLVEACHDAGPRPGFDSVRLPGEQALILAERQRREGVAVSGRIVEDLVAWAQKLGVDPPARL